ncbi:penicillin-binding protein [Nocardioides humilatus]|uniref:Penicillin-binding protein n=1 Tax=Nocardioides humilatus TaxID=2607660 RepID=A0A5B1L4Y6_9ACTN|nr:penicillin-binding transpeptidase domain-containing protein [Nocardioides humilatus]KAA1415506.1 penicillin-binding protein [Nocardioides humilatus]
MRRISVALPTCLMLLLSACSDEVQGDDSDEAKAVAGALAKALAEPDAEARSKSLETVPFANEQPSIVAERYSAIITGMDGITPTIEVGDFNDDKGFDTVGLTWSWPVVEGEDPWTYDTLVELTPAGDGWQVTWQQGIVVKDLGKEEVLDATTVPAKRGEILGADGAVLVTERPVTRIGIDRVQVKGAKAAQAAGQLATLVGIDVAAYVKAVKAAGDRAFVEAITYRKGEVPSEVEAGLRSIDGSLAVADEIALAPTKDFAAPILGRVGPVTAEMIEEDPERYEVGDIAGVSGLQARYDDQLGGTPGRVVEAVSETNPRSRELYRVDGADGDPLELTLDPHLQSTAEDLLAGIVPSSALVAIRPSDGAILAAANGPGNAGQNFATYGQFPPGSTMKIVSSLALLRAGLTPDSTVSCPATLDVDGKEFKNYTGYPSSALGDIPLRTALAQSCNTAFIGARDELGPDDLVDAAASLGLGVDHDLGFPAYFGSVLPPASETEKGADMIGQGTVLASPMTMASVIASVQKGALVVPRLLTQVDVADHDNTPLTGKEAEQLRTMLRGVVTEGSGSLLVDLPGDPVIAKTGTAEFEGDGGIQTHAWMIAAQGDLAVAVFVGVGESGSQTAGPILEAFLRAAAP